MPETNQSEVANPEIEKHVALERIQNLYHDSRVVSFTAAVAAILMGLMLWSSQPQHLVIIWVVTHILISLARGVVLYNAFKHKVDNLSDAMKWAKLYSLVALISGLVWGSLPWLMFDPASTYNVSAIVIVMFGMAAASNVALSAFPAAFFCFALPSLGGLFFRLISEGGDFTYVGIMLLAFIFFSLIQSIRIFRMISSSIRQRFENVELMRDLEVKKQEADKANLDKSRFLAATSHDLRQPLHALDLYLGALEVNLDSDLQKDVMHKAKKSSQSVSELLNALLDISRLDAGEVQVNIHDVPISSLFSGIISEWTPQFEKENRMLRTFSLHESIQTDPILLSRMLGNLLANVIRHTHGNVLLGSRRRGGFIRLEVWDQGEGIPAESLNYVFTEYFQLNNPERDRTKGLGLGLATVKRLSLLLNHPVHIRSFPNKGLCFSIDVPRAVSHDSSPYIEADFKLNIAGNFILVIDDEEAIRDSLQMLLGAWGCEVLVAESGQTAIDEMKRDNYPAPDAIITDYRLRENQVGVKAASSVMKFFEKKIPTLIVTGDKDNEVTTACKSLGYDLLHKPLSSNDLQKALQKLLKTTN